MTKLDESLIIKIFQSNLGADTDDFSGTLTVRAEGGTVSAAVFELGQRQATVLPVTRLR